jgi:hypothetical protein
MFRFDRKDPEDISASAFNLISEGEGYFRVNEVVEKVSRKGNDMLQLTHQLWNDKGEKTLYNQYIIANEYAADNIYQILLAAGRTDLYPARGEISTEILLGLKGKCMIATDKGQIKDDGSKYADKSKIKYFIAYKANTIEEGNESQITSEDIDDDIPWN